MTPYEIHIALAIYCSPSNWRDQVNCDISTPHWRQTVQKFKDEGLLCVHTDMCTEKLRVYVLALQEMPLPVQQWVMQEAKR